MQPSKYLSLFAAFSALVSCRGQGPAVTVCLLDPTSKTLQCGKPDGTGFELPIEEGLEDHACMTLADLQLLVDYAKRRCR